MVASTKLHPAKAGVLPHKGTLADDDDDVFVFTVHKNQTLIKEEPAYRWLLCTIKASTIC